MRPASTIVDQAAPNAAGALSAALQGRANILEMTATAEAAVLRPADPGGWPHPLRAALAARIARLHGEAALADRYAAMAGDDPAARIADPAEDGGALDLGVVTAFVDRIAAAPRDATAADIAGLQAAGVTDADIVRLCEIIAFHAYQLRVIAGVRLMGGAPA